MSAREDILKRVEKVLTNMTNPGPGTVSREFFDFEKNVGGELTNFCLYSIEDQPDLVYFFVK